MPPPVHHVEQNLFRLDPQTANKTPIAPRILNFYQQGITAGRELEGHNVIVDEAIAADPLVMHELSIVSNFDAVVAANS